MDILWITAILTLLPRSVLLAGDRASFHQIADDFWTWRLEQVPEFATSVGVHDYDDSLESFTIQAFQHRKDFCESLLQRLYEIDITKLTPKEQLDHLVLRSDLHTYVDGYDWINFGNLNPMNFLEGNQRDFSFWLDAMDFSTEEGFRNYIVRLRALATQIYEQINLMREAIVHGFTNHRISVEHIPQELQILETSHLATPFFKPFNDSLKYTDMSSNKQEKIRAEGEIVVIDQVLPAYRRLRTFLTHEYIPSSRPGLGLASLPRGLEYYQARLRWHLGVGVLPSPEKLYRLGVLSVERLLADMEDIKNGVNYDGELHEFLKYAHGANKFFYRSERDLLEAYREIVNTKIPKKMARYFKYSQVQDFQIQKMPFDGPAGVMMPGSEDGMMKGVFFVNVHNPLKWPKWTMMTTALHETLPGRLLQVQYERNQSLPSFRKFREFRKSYAAPFQFPFHSAFIEGWALYAESLGRDMRLLNSKYDQFGQLFSELYRACEMVVDTGIHAFGWSMEEAIDYLVQHTGVSSSQAEQDIKRIITIPGQAVAPEYGHIMIKLLRKKAELHFGEFFDIREFHDQVLRLGPVPLKTLEYYISLWIQENGPREPNSAITHTTNYSQWILSLISCIYLSLIR